MCSIAPRTCTPPTHAPAATPTPAHLPAHRSLPRVGVRLGAAPQLQRVQWYGRGPFECYPDRKLGALLRCHEARAVHDMHVPYVFPSECGWVCGGEGQGGRWGWLMLLVLLVLWAGALAAGSLQPRVMAMPRSTACASPPPSLPPPPHHPHPPLYPPAGESGGRADVRWVALTPPPAEGGWGLAVAAAGGGSMQQMSASTFSWEAFEAAAHDHELQVCVCAWRRIPALPLPLLLLLVCPTPEPTHLLHPPTRPACRRPSPPPRGCTWMHRTWGWGGTTAGTLLCTPPTSSPPSATP